MSNHPTKIGKMSAKQLADEFSKTTYKYQLNFFKTLVTLYDTESKMDKERGYTRLSIMLLMLSHQVSFLISFLNDIWKVCKNKTNIGE